MMAAILNSPLPNDPFMDGYNMGQRDSEAKLNRLRAENAELRHRLIHSLTCELEEHEIAEYRNYLDKTTNETKPT